MGESVIESVILEWGGEEIGRTKGIKLPVHQEVHRMEYYMRRGNNFYFRNYRAKLKATVSEEECEQLKETLSYGDAVTIEAEIE